MSGISASIDHKELEKTVCKVLKHIDINITEGKMESCHRVNKPSDRSSNFPDVRIVKK